MKKIEDINLAIAHKRLLREKFLSDPFRPNYHFVTPEDYGVPGDPNGAFYANGRYHLMYLYESRSDYFRWGHLSSSDLVHWISHPDALIPDTLDGGVFSGGAFLDDDGTCYLSYWSLPVGENCGGVRIAKSSDYYYKKWEKFDSFVLECTENGLHEVKDQNGLPTYICCADPSNIWKKDNKYYMTMGNLPILIKFKMDGLSQYSQEEKDGVVVPDNLKGDWVDLFESSDLKEWKYLHRFYERKETGEWTAENEDAMCPSFLPLPTSKNGGGFSQKYIQLFISHNKGCQYYIGNYDEDKDKFYPEQHGRMSWVDNAFFAPEALIDEKGRQIMWSWLHDNPENEKDNGWSGVFSLPRVIWLREDNSLGIAPASELDDLRYNTKIFENITLEREPYLVKEVNGLSCEINLSVKLADCDEIGFYLRASEDLTESTKVYYSKKDSKLYFDTTNCPHLVGPIIEKAPLKLEDGENLDITIYIDKCVIEVFANEKQAITRRVYPQGENSENIFIYGNVTLDKVTVHEISPTNFC